MMNEPDMKHRRKRPHGTSPRVGDLVVGVEFLGLSGYGGVDLFGEGILALFPWEG